MTWQATSAQPCRLRAPVFGQLRPQLLAGHEPGPPGFSPSHRIILFNPRLARWTYIRLRVFVCPHSEQPRPLPHMIRFSSINEDSQCMSMTWRATSAWLCQKPGGAHVKVGRPEVVPVLVRPDAPRRRRARHRRRIPHVQVIGSWRTRT